MVCPSDAQARQRLEGLYQRSPSIPFSAQFWEFLQQIGQALVTELTRDRNEPRISKYYDIEGKALWHVYDPRSQQRLTCVSESEVLAWLEARHTL